MTKYNKEIKEHLEEIKYVAGYLEDLSKAFEIVGNESLSLTLSINSVSLINSCKEINNLISKSIDDRYKEAMQTSGTILEAMLQGIEIGKEDGNRNQEDS